MNRNSFCMRMAQDWTVLCKSATSSNCQPHRIFFSEITGGQIRVVRRMTKHFNGPSVDHIDGSTSRLRSQSYWENLPHSRWNRWTKRRHDSILWVFWHTDCILGIHLAHIYNLLIFKLWWIIVCTVPTLQSSRWLTSLTVIHLSLSRSCLISWTFCDVIDVGRPLRCSSITLSYPFSYCEYHLCNAVLFIVASPYALTNISIVSFLCFTLRTQNLIAVLCLTLILMHLVQTKLPLSLKWRHTLMWRHWCHVKIWRHTVLKFGDDIGSDASDRRHFRRDTGLRFVKFWAGCYEVTLP